MILFDNFITDLKELLKGEKRSYNPNNSLEKGDKNSIIFQKDTAYELGGSQKKCTSALAVSSKFKFDNSITLIGNDIKDIKSDCEFAKFIFVEIKDFESEDEAFSKIKELEYVKYNFSLKGFMTRASALGGREQIRVDKKAVKKKISFYDYGSELIKEYLKFDFVKSVDVYFVTRFDDMNTLCDYSSKISSTTSALNHILDNVMFDCSTCNLKEICDEVEGMKELHFKVVRGRTAQS